MAIRSRVPNQHSRRSEMRILLTFRHVARWTRSGRRTGARLVPPQVAYSMGLPAIVTIEYTLRAGLAPRLPLTVSYPRSNYKTRRRVYAEQAKGFFAHRTSDRRGDYSDHRGDCHPQLAAFEVGSERSVAGWLFADDQHGLRHLFDDLWHGLSGRYVQPRSGRYGIRGCG